MAVSTLQRRDGDGSVLEVSGELDTVTVAAFRRALTEAAAGTGRCTLDLTAVTFMDSAGLGALVAAQRDLTGTGTTLVVRPSPPVLRLLGVAGLLHHFALDPPAPHIPNRPRR